MSHKLQKDIMLDEMQLVEFDIDGNKVKLSPSIVKNYITGGQQLSDQEYKFFVEMAKVRKLNPFLKEIYAIKYSENQPAQIVVGKDAILKRAIQHPQYDGKEQGIIVVNRKGEIEERKGTFRLNDEELVGGWARVYRKDISHPTYISVSFDEVKQEKNVYERTESGKSRVVGKELNSNWSTKGATMVEKVALVRALRETFVEDLGGMVDADEAWQEQPKVEVKQEIIEQNEPEIIEAELVEPTQQSIDDL